VIDLRAWRGRAARVLGAAWRTRMGKLTVVLLVAAPWYPKLLLLPAVWYGARLAGAGMRRLLWSVRARLAAFYLFAALVPILLVLAILVAGGFFVLGQVSARIVEERLERQVEWAEQRTARLERAYWRARTLGVDPPGAARRALDEAYGDVEAAGFGCWAADSAAGFLEVRGAVAARDARVPAWLGARRFAGIAVGDSNRLEIRTRLRIREPRAAFEFGSRLPVDTRVLNRGLGGDADDVRAGLGAPDRSLRECTTLPDSLILHQGVVAYVVRGTEVKVTPTQVSVQDAPARADSSRGRLRLRRAGSPAVTTQTTLEDSAFREAPGLDPGLLRVRSRFGLLQWYYLGYPLEWESGRTDLPGPPVVIAFSVEGATRALLRTGVGMIGNSAGVLFYVLASVVGFLLALQIVATLLGFRHARAISRSVSRLDRGVQAIRAGDFGHRIAPKERDQLGALALAFDEMSGRLQGLLEERAAVQAVERELAIARDVQRRLFPERVPYAPFFEAAGVCLPARTVSGDYYDFLEVGGTHDAVVADVSGKGISAALLMASLHSALRSLYLRHGRAAPPDPAEVVTRLNQHLHAYIEPTRFVTLFLVRYAGDGRLVYCNAGHNPAALVQDGRIEWLSAGGLMLGPFPDLEYASAQSAVRPGDLVCLYTDGVTEAESPAGEQFGEERLGDVLRGAASRPPAQVIAAVQEAVGAWREGGEPGDDLTLVVLRITA
jgi:serine phosphatase RsbU (regulator of sigma subunit)